MYRYYSGILILTSGFQVLSIFSHSTVYHVSRLDFSSTPRGTVTPSLGKPFQCLTTLSEKKMSPNFQPKTLLVQREAIPSTLITSYL